jgi:integrase
MKALVRVKRWHSLPHYDFVVTWRQGGKRRLRYFKRERDAKMFAGEKEVELLNEGRKHGEITSEERQAILLARENGFPVREAVEFYIDHHAAIGRSISVEEAIEEFLSIREGEGKSQTHLRDLRSRLGAFSASHGKLVVAEMDTRLVDRWLTGLRMAAQTRINYRRVLHNFFSFACARGYASRNPVTGASKAKVVAKPPGILSVAQVRGILEACSLEILPAVAIGLFAGLRRAELERLPWRDVSLAGGFIEVSALNSKTAQRRLVTISPNLKAWLAPLCRERGPVFPPANIYRNLFGQALKRSGIKRWPANGLRHSFASYHLAHYQDAAKTALQLGHTESVTLFRHYRELVRPEDAEAFWGICPPEKNANGNVIAMSRQVAA